MCSDEKVLEDGLAITKAEYEVLANVRYTLRRFLRFSELTALELNTTPQHYQALQAIQGFPGRDWVTMTELAERLQVHHHSAVGLVNRLAAQDLVERRQDAHDRRQVIISLTPAGLELLARVAAPHLREWRRVAPEIRRLLGQMVDAEQDDGDTRD